MTGESAHGVGTRTLRSMFWAYGSYVGGRGLVLVSTAALARILTPADFGLVALALVFIGFLETLSDLGMTQALIIVDEDEVLEKAETAFTVSVLVGAALAIIVGALGPVAASFFHQPALIAIMPVLGFNLFLQALGTTHYALAQKWLDFRLRTSAELADVVLRGGAGITLALLGAGAWSLVIGYLVGTMTLNIVLWIRVRWRPRLRLKREHLRQLLTFGGALTGVLIIGAVLGSADDLIVGRVLGTTALGLYTLAYRLPDLLIINLSAVAGKVLFPAMATLKRPALPEAFLTSLRYGLMIGLPLAVGLAVLAEPVTLALFGDKWRAAAPAMQVMALWTLMWPINIMIGTAYKSLGRADILLKIAIPQALALVPAVLIFVHDGIVAVAACQAGVTIAFTLLAAGIATRILDVTVRDMLVACRPAILASAGLGAALFVVHRLIEQPWPALVTGIVVGAAVYIALLWLVARDTLERLRATAFPRAPRPAS